MGLAWLLLVGAIDGKRQSHHADWKPCLSGSTDTDSGMHTGRHDGICFIKNTNICKSCFTHTHTHTLLSTSTRFKIRLGISLNLPEQLATQGSTKLAALGFFRYSPCSSAPYLDTHQRVTPQHWCLHHGLLRDSLDGGSQGRQRTSASLTLSNNLPASPQTAEVLPFAEKNILQGHK